MCTQPGRLFVSRCMNGDGLGHHRGRSSEFCVTVMGPVTRTSGITCLLHASLIGCSPCPAERSKVMSSFAT